MSIPGTHCRAVRPTCTPAWPTVQSPTDLSNLHINPLSKKTSAAATYATNTRNQHATSISEQQQIHRKAVEGKKLAKSRSIGTRVPHARRRHSRYQKGKTNQGPDLQNILRFVSRLSDNNSKVTIDLRQTSTLQNILRRTQGFS